MAERITFTEELTDLAHMNLLEGFSPREAYIEEMAALLESDPSKYMFVGAEGASYSGKLLELKAKLPECFLEFGIAEQNAVGAASGLALCGKTVFLNGFGPFLAPHLEGRQEPQASSLFRTPTAGSLQSWDRRVRNRLV